MTLQFATGPSGLTHSGTTVINLLLAEVRGVHNSREKGVRCEERERCLIFVVYLASTELQQRLTPF